LQQTLLNIPEFIGHLHPVLVHLPIGILLLACLFLILTRNGKNLHLQPAINLVLLLGLISAIVSCITGYILSDSGDYDEELVGLHQWMGISVAVSAIIIYYIRRKAYFRQQQWLLASILVLLVVGTGHLGGSLTHGADYLTMPLKDLGTDSVAVSDRKPIPNVQEAVVYTDIIKPILQSKCYGCHGATKQKGKLRLDQPEWILKGGKDGVVVVSGNSGKSDLVKRILLPREEEHHMAPKEKPQLTSSDKALIVWWVDQGADFSKKVKELQQQEKIKPLLNALQKSDVPKVNLSDIPSVEVPKGDPVVIGKLRDFGVLIQPVSVNSNYLEANFINAIGPADSLTFLLTALKNQLVRLKLSGMKLSDKNIIVLGQCTNIRRLALDHTGITDAGMGNLQSLEQLQSLNLVGTSVTAKGVQKLRSLKHLQVIYLFQSGVTSAEWQGLTQSFPGVTLDSGRYSIPFLASDTIVVKAPKYNP